MTQHDMDLVALAARMEAPAPAYTTAQRAGIIASIAAGFWLWAAFLIWVFG